MNVTTYLVGFESTMHIFSCYLSIDPKMDLLSSRVIDAVNSVQSLTLDENIIY